MDISETVQKVLQEVVVPDLGKIKDERSKILAILELTNKRLDDVNTHLADQMPYPYSSQIQTRALMVCSQYQYSDH